MNTRASVRRPGSGSIMAIAMINPLYKYLRFLVKELSFRIPTLTSKTRARIPLGAVIFFQELNAELMAFMFACNVFEGFDCIARRVSSAFLISLGVLMLRNVVSFGSICLSFVVGT